MAEVQTNVQTGELTQRFIEFVMMQAQNAALFLGQIPNPQTGQPETNLEVARMFIDQLAMIQEKTRGNLSNEEATVLRNTLSSLQLAFVEASQAERSGGTSSPRAEQPDAPARTASEPAAAQTSAPEKEGVTMAPPESESKKKFTKSYGS